MSSSTSNRVLELVVFRLRDTARREQFLDTEPAVTRWIAEQPGFLAHDLAYSAESDQWVEVAWWRTMDDAEAATDRAMSSAECAPMFELIDMEARDYVYLHAEGVAAATRSAEAVSL